MQLQIWGARHSQKQHEQDNNQIQLIKRNSHSYKFRKQFNSFSKTNTVTKFKNGSALLTQEYQSPKNTHQNAFKINKKMLHFHNTNSKILRITSMHNLVCKHINIQPLTDQRQHFNLSRKQLMGPLYKAIIEIINSMDEFSKFYSPKSFQQHPSMQTK